MAQLEPQSANEYDDRTSAAVKSVIVEIGQVLGSFQGKFAIVGGAVPWLLLEDAEMAHVGTLDVDVGLDAEALGDGEYAKLVESLQGHGYEQNADLRKFQLVRTVPAKDGGDDIKVVVDFLMPREAVIEKNKPPLIDGFAVIKADGADIALEHYEIIKVKADMPNGGTNSVRIAVASIAALLAMKGFAINGRDKPKDAYDIYYSIRHYPDGVSALAEATAPLLENTKALEGYGFIAEKFEELEGYGPTCVRRFLEDSESIGEQTPDQIQQDAFGQVNAWLKAVGLR
jgi:hypothetical protein